MKFDDYADKNSFVRLANIPLVKKFIDKMCRLKYTIPSELGKEDQHDFWVKNGRWATKDDFCEAWQKYPWKDKDGEYCRCEREIFAERIFNKVLKNRKWVLFSEIENERYNPHRINTVLWIMNTQYYNSATNDFGYIRFTCMNLCGETIFKDIFVDELINIVFRICTAFESELFAQMINLKYEQPETCADRMWIDEHYKGHYDDYLNDCKKYGFTPITKVLIENSTCDFGITKEGVFDGGLKWPDYRYVNIKDEK